MLLVKKYNTYYSTIYLFYFLILIIFPSLFSILLDGSSKRVGMYPGIILSSIIFFLLNNYNIKRQTLVHQYFFVLIISIHILLNYIFNDKGLNIRSLNSLFLIILILFMAYTLSNVCKNVRNISIEKTLFYSFIILNMDLIFTLLIKYNSVEKSFFLFPEPSHFTLIYIPILFFNIFRFRLLKFTFFISVLFLVAIYIKNLVLLFGIFMILILYLLRNKYYIFILIFFFIFCFTIKMQDYFYDRINIIDTKNLSLLVFLCGWERAYLSLLNTNGMGVGLNQLGNSNYIGSFRDILIELNNPLLNIHDAGTTAPKIISEFGILGIMFILIFIINLFKSFKVLISVSFISPKLLLYFSFLLASFFELFVRGTGYFNVNMLMLFTSIIMHKKNTL